MKRIIAGLTMGVFLMSAAAQGVAVTTSTHVDMDNENKSSWTVEKGQCAANALDKRDTAIIAAADTMNASVKVALTARKDALKAAWTTADKTAREAARKSAWSAFKTSANTAHEKMRTARKAAWATFNSDMTTCGFKNHGEKLEIMSRATAY